VPEAKLFRQSGAMVFQQSRVVMVFQQSQVVRLANLIPMIPFLSYRPITSTKKIDDGLPTTGNVVTVYINGLAQHVQCPECRDRHHVNLLQHDRKYLLYQLARQFRRGRQLRHLLPVSVTEVAAIPKYHHVAG
jgi:hypothetical protein